MSIYEYIPVNEHLARSNLSTLSNSPMSEVRVNPIGRANPMFPGNTMRTPFTSILMIEIGSSPERIKDDTKSSQNRKMGELLVHQGLSISQGGFNISIMKTSLVRTVKLVV
jgi:hypothetical protein